MGLSQHMSHVSKAELSAVVQILTVPAQYFVPILE